MRHLIVPDSDIIDSIGFEQSPINPELLGALEVIFKSTPDIVYRYESVGVDTFIRLISAESIGKSFHELFKRTKHPFTKSEKKPTLKK
jgi:hypothetical protein